MKTDVIENHKVNQTIIDIVPSNCVIDSINLYLRNEQRNIGKDDYCYIRFVRKHLEIGLIKIICVE